MTDEGKKLARARHALVEKGDVEGALASLNQCLEDDPSEALLYRERAHLYLYLGRTQQARSDFDVTERLAARVFRTQPGQLQSNMACDALGVTYWMEGHRELALEFWRYSTRSLIEGRVGYAQMGGGIESGLLLWFGAVHSGRVEDTDLVRTLYEKQMASTHWSHDLTSWPCPIAQFLLGHIDESTLLGSTPEHKQSACKAYFTLAVRARQQCQHSAYRNLMKLVAPGEGAGEVYEYYNVLPYFLGRFEVGDTGG